MNDLKKTRPVGIENLNNMELLPFLKKGVKVGFLGSLDKSGGNDDWDWWLAPYKDDEWLIFDVKGAGCIYNFFQHRFHEDFDVTFRFYFDGSDTPQFEMKQSEIGKKHPFTEPLADIYNDWVHRSFVPMPFKNGCRITSSVRLFGSMPDYSEGGWGVVIWHSYDSPEGVRTFTGKEDFSALFDKINDCGKDPKDTRRYIYSNEKINIKRGEAAEVFGYSGRGALASINLKVGNFRRIQLKNMWIKIYFDGDTEPYVNCPFGAFFGNEFGNADTKILTRGMTNEGEFYCYFPMPFWKSVKVEIIRTYSGYTHEFLTNEVDVKIGILPGEAFSYPKEACGYFHADYKERAHTRFYKDMHIGKARGYGHLVGAMVTLHGINSVSKRGYCEGDVRVYIDGKKTPQVSSDGSESWAGFGWGFSTPPERTPFTAYDGLESEYTWTMLKECVGDWYPFYEELIFNIEHGGRNNLHADMSGMMMYYLQEGPAIIETDYIEIADPESEKAHNYKVFGENRVSDLFSKYEGDENVFFSNDLGLRDVGRYFKGKSEFEVTISERNKGVRLVRKCDQERIGMCARVYVDGEQVSEKDWYWADRNPFLRWYEDDFDIPARYTEGKSKIKVTIEHIPAENAEYAEKEPYHLHYEQGASSTAVRLSSNIADEIYAKTKGNIKSLGLRFKTISVDESDLDIAAAESGSTAISFGIRDSVPAVLINGVPHTLGCENILDGNWHFAAIELEKSKVKVLVDGNKALETSAGIEQMSDAKVSIGCSGKHDISKETAALLDEMIITPDACEKEEDFAAAKEKGNVLAVWDFERDSAAKHSRDKSGNGFHMVRYNKIPFETAAAEWNEFHYKVYSYIK